MRNRLILLCVCVNCIWSVNAQHGKLEKLAKKAFRHEDFSTATQYYKELISYNTDNIDYNYHLAICYFNTGYADRSIPYFEFVRSKKITGQYENTGYYLGKAYHLDHKFEKAIQEYESFLKNLGAKSGYDAELSMEITKSIRNCEVGVTLASTPVNCVIRNLYDKINTEADERYPLISPDGKYLYFSGDKGENLDNQTDGKELKNPGDIYFSANINGQYTYPKILAFSLSSPYLDAPVHISPDGNTMYFLSVTPSKAMDIYISEKINQVWIKPREIGAPFNSEGNETGFCMTPDRNMAVFSSDRPGGYGGQDLYIAYRDEKGAWSEAINMGPNINSKYNETAPSIATDGKTIYFSGDGMNSIGGYDLFRTKFVRSVWTQPENLGFPINSAADEKALTMYSDGIRGYFESDRKGGAGQSDLYTLQIIDTSISPAKYLSYYQDDNVFEEVPKKTSPGHKLKEIVYFDFNASSIAQFSEKRLDKIVLLLNTYPDIKLEVQGYTDNKGSDEGNHLVSSRRAKAVYRYLISKGVNSDRIQPVGYATQSPVSTGASELEQAQNRRVEFKVLPAETVIRNNAYLGEYYVVKGSFSSKTNAEKMREQLSRESIRTAILEPDNNNPLYRVVLGKAGSYEEAAKILNSTPEAHKEGVWILSF